MGFSQLLVEWYRVNKRDLPWRETTNPYFIWVSEVILQQTRVAQGIGYYNSFTEAFPTVFDLAKADIDEVLKVWQGLGYYSRARNMHTTAKELVANHGGRFPSTYSELIKLKGVGDYTASAIAAFAFKEPVAAIDGNVYRIFARLFDVATPIDTAQGKKELRAIAYAMLDTHAPDVYNQAIMDFGGTVCMPKKPHCLCCPAMELCAAFRNRRVDLLPVKAKKVKQRNRYFTYVVPFSKGVTFISKRSKNDIWQSLYEFPLIETDSQLSVEQITSTNEWQGLFGSQQVEIVFFSEPQKYVLSHQHLYTRFIIVRMNDDDFYGSSEYQKVSVDEVGRYSTSRLIENFLAAESALKYLKSADGI